jgi:transcriptional regulator with XRE-family HTH domain
VEFGVKLRALRASRGLTLRQMADIAGVSLTFLSDVERGERPAFQFDRMRDLLDLVAATDEERRAFQPYYCPFCGCRSENVSVGTEP